MTNDAECSGKLDKIELITDGYLRSVGMNNVLKTKGTLFPFLMP